MKSSEVTGILTADRPNEVGVTGSHHHFRHPTKAGKVTVPHPSRDIPVGTLWSIWKQAGLPKRRS